MNFAADVSERVKRCGVLLLAQMYVVSFSLKISTVIVPSAVVISTEAVFSSGRRFASSSQPEAVQEASWLTQASAFPASISVPEAPVSFHPAVSYDVSRSMRNDVFPTVLFTAVMLAALTLYTILLLSESSVLLNTD